MCLNKYPRAHIEWHIQLEAASPPAPKKGGKGKKEGNATRALDAEPRQARPSRRVFVRRALKGYSGYSGVLRVLRGSTVSLASATASDSVSNARTHSTGPALAVLWSAHSTPGTPTVLWSTHSTIHIGLDVEEGCYSTGFSTVMLTKVLQIPCSLCC